MEYFVLYLIGNVKNIVAMFVIMWVLLATVTPIIKIPLSDMRWEDYKFPMKTFVAWMAMIFFAILIPSERSVQYMAAYYVGKQAIQTETVKKLTELVNVKLDEEIKDALKSNSK